MVRVNVRLVVGAASARGNIPTVPGSKMRQDREPPSHAMVGDAEDAPRGEQTASEHLFVVPPPCRPRPGRRPWPSQSGSVRRMIAWEDVVELGRALPEAEESTSYGTPSLRVRGKMFARLRTNPDAIVVRCDLDEKPLLLEARPDILFETPHYHGFSAMLIRLEASRDDLLEFLTDSYALVAPRSLAASLRLD